MTGSLFACMGMTSAVNSGSSGLVWSSSGRSLADILVDITPRQIMLSDHVLMRGCDMSLPGADSG